MKDLIIVLLLTTVVVLLVILGNAGNSYNKGFEAGKNYVPPVMQRIDRMQNLTAAMKETALDRLAKMSTDSVEKIIKQAGY